MPRLPCPRDPHGYCLVVIRGECEFGGDCTATDATRADYMPLPDLIRLVAEMNQAWADA